MEIQKSMLVQLYDKKVYIFTTGLKEMDGTRGVAASLKTNRIAFEKYRMKIALEPQRSLLSKSSKMVTR